MLAEDPSYGFEYGLNERRKWGSIRIANLCEQNFLLN
jgi:hypothetical protein